MRRKKATHQPLPSESYTWASVVKITRQDPTRQELRDDSWQRWEEPLTKGEQAKVLAEDWLAVLPGGKKGPQIVRSPRKPSTWGMSATRKEREEAHRRRIEGLLRSRESAVVSDEEDAMSSTSYRPGSPGTPWCGQQEP